MRPSATPSGRNLDAYSEKYRRLRGTIMAANNYHTHITSKHRWYNLNLKEVWQYRDLI